MLARASSPDFEIKTVCIDILLGLLEVKSGLYLLINIIFSNELIFRTLPTQSLFPSTLAALNER